MKNRMRKFLSKSTTRHTPNILASPKILASLAELQDAAKAFAGVGRAIAEQQSRTDAAIAAAKRSVDSAADSSGDNDDELARVKAELAETKRKLTAAGNVIKDAWALADANTPVEFTRVVGGAFNGEEIIVATNITPEDAAGICPNLGEWARDCVARKRFGAVYDGGNHAVFCVRPLGS